MSNEDTTSLTYQQAGVDIDRANALIDKIKHIAKRTNRDGVMAGIGGFGAMFEIPVDRYQQPVLVSGTDGVGTKLKIAMKMQQHDTIGIDLVAMCVNDIITQGAEPLYFLDYLATGELNPTQAEAVISGIGRGCELAGCALIGGETAEMPGMYHGDDYDLAGFCVGVVEKSKIVDGSQVQPGDALIGMASSGPHSNGYSLIRRILKDKNVTLSQMLGEQTLGKILLEPTRIYVKALLSLMQKVNVHGLAHITGGGLTENLPRIMPNGTQAVINTHSWEWPDVFQWLAKQGNVATSEMYKTFNNGVGMVAFVAKKDAEQTIELLNQAGEQAWVIGEVQASTQNKPHVVFQDA